MRAPLTFVWRNLLFGRDADDAWALYRLATCAYSGLPVSRKRELLGTLAAFAYSVEADFQLLRVEREWSADTYRDGALSTVDPCDGHPTRLAAHLDLQAAALRARRVSQPEVYVAIRLHGSEASVSDWRTTVRSLLGLRDPRGLSQRRMDALLASESRLFARILDFVDADRAGSTDVQWLVRRCYARARGEPEIEEFWQPQALVLEDDEDVSRRRYEPLEADVLRLFDAPITQRGRSVLIETEAGESHQAFLALGALPENVTFPGRQAELLFAPLEALPFPVDAVFAARWIANERALALARRKLIDADHAYDEELHGDHGPTSTGVQRPAVARELEDYLTSAERPPLLRGSVGLCVAATSEEELERRVERLRHEYLPVRLHRPLGGQLDLFISHLPAQHPRQRAYDDVFCCEQFGGMVPTATHAVGSAAGTYIGHALSGSAQPVLFDVTEASRTSRPPAVLCAGTLGSGKTLTALLLAYQAFLAGSRIVTVDPKGDHHLDTLIGAEHVEAIELLPDAAHRGLLDPLRIGTADTRAELAYSFLVDLLPAPVSPEWQTEIRAAVDASIGGGATSCATVIAALNDGNADARKAARAIGVHADAGLMQLAIADAQMPPPPATDRQVTCLRIANLTLPLPETKREDFTAEERAGRVLLRLLASYALRLMGGDWSRHKVLVFDEAWMLLGDATGHALVSRINRLCRSQNATPILATQVLADIGELENLIGALMCFGVQTDGEARRALQLLGLDADDQRLRSQLQAFRRGRCFMRDYEGRVAPVQIDPVDPAILDALDTRPARAA